MATIRVYVPKEGKWSEPIIGVSKSFLIKRLIAVVANQVIHRGEKTPSVLPIELNFEEPLVDEFITGVYYEDFVDETGDVVSIKRSTSLIDDRFWGALEYDWKKLGISHIQSVMVSIGVLKKLVATLNAEKYNYISPAVQEIINRADLASLGISDDDYKLFIRLKGV